MRIRRSTALLLVAWIATFAVYLQVRPAPQPTPSAPAPAAPATTTTSR